MCVFVCDVINWEQLILNKILKLTTFAYSLCQKYRKKLKRQSFFSTIIYFIFNKIIWTIIIIILINLLLDNAEDKK